MKIVEKIFGGRAMKTAAYFEEQIRNGYDILAEF